MEARKEKKENPSQFFNNEHTNILPKEVWAKVFSCLNRKDLNNTRLACSFFHRASKEQPINIPYYPLLDYSQRCDEENKDAIFTIEKIKNCHSMLVLSNQEILLASKTIIAVVSFNNRAVSHVQDLCLNQHRDDIHVLAVAKLSEQFIVASYNDSFIRLWDRCTGQCVKAWTPSDRQIYDQLLVRKDGIIIAANRDKFCLLEIKEDQLLCTQAISGIACEYQAFWLENIFLNEQDDIVTLSSNNLTVWNRDDCAKKKSIRCPISASKSCLLSEDRLLGISDYIKNEISIWDFNKNEIKLSIKLKDDNFGFLGDGFELRADIIATRGERLNQTNDKGVSLWTLQGDCIMQLQHSHIRNFVIMPDGRIITLGGVNGNELCTWQFERALQPKAAHSRAMRGKG